MKFLWCTYYVKDMKESLQFYKDIVGLDIDKKFPIESGEIVFLGSGETKVELIFDGTDKWQGSKDGISLGFETDSLDEKMQMVKEKGIEIEGPFRPNPNTGFFFIKDPNGVKIQFVEQN